MPDMNGIEATRRLIALSKQIKVIALSVHSDTRFVEAMLKAGARGYLTKDCAFVELALAVRTVVGDRFYFSSSIADIVMDDYLSRLSTDNDSFFPVLTAREREILQLLAEGRSVKQIALRLQVSPKTVETHRIKIMHKLNVHSLPELTKYAIREGLTSLEIE